jgi:hypothetical protein
VDGTGPGSSLMAEFGTSLVEPTDLLPHSEDFTVPY